TNSVDDTIKPPYSMALNFSIGRELPQNFFIEASYVVRLSRRSLTQRDLAQPPNLVDPQSGQTYWDAVNELAALRDSGAPISTGQTIPWFENMMPGMKDFDWEGSWAGLPNLPGGSSATQNMLYYLAGDDAMGVSSPFLDYIAWGGADDFISVLADMDLGWLLPANAAGRNSMFSSQYSALAAWSSIGHGNYHAAQLTVRKRFSQGFQFDLNYTFSKSLDLASTAERVTSYEGLIVNAYDSGAMKSYSDYDMRHQVNANWVAELPFGRGKKWGNSWNSVVNTVLGGWQISGLWRMTSGLPTDIGNGGTWPTNWNVPGFATQVGPSPAQGVYKNAAAPDGTSGPNAFADPVSAVDAWSHTRAGGTGQRNGVRGGGYFTIDVGVAKRFQLPFEGHSMQLRWETFNVTNTPSFDVAPENWSLGQGASFGKYSYLLTNPRVMQFALRYEF
ncbi:MAG: hypothetical protein GY953_35130, partial [bacterium]|nr:hypothetical protein [bacterium]